jgi:hypothetical protein
MKPPCLHVPVCLSACSMTSRVQFQLPEPRTCLTGRHATLVCSLRWCMIGYSHGNNLEGHNRAHHSRLEAPPLRAPHLHRRSFWNALPQTEPAAWHSQGQDNQKGLGTSENAEKIHLRYALLQLVVVESETIIESLSARGIISS